MSPARLAVSLAVRSAAGPRSVARSGFRAGFRSPLPCAVSGVRLLPAQARIDEDGMPASLARPGTVAHLGGNAQVRSQQSRHPRALRDRWTIRTGFLQLDRHLHAERQRVGRHRRHSKPLTRRSLSSRQTRSPADPTNSNTKVGFVSSSRR